MTFFHDLNEVEERELVPGFFAKLIHTDEMTVAHFRVLAGSVLPEHFHIHAQVTNVLEGEFEMTVNGETHLCKGGTSITVPPNVPHSGRALTDCRLVDIFQPTREDYR